MAGGRRKGGWGRPVSGGFSRRRRGGWGGGAREDRALPDGGLLGARGGWEMRARRYRGAGGGDRLRRGSSGEVGAAWSGRGASPRHEGAVGGVD